MIKKTVTIIALAAAVLLNCTKTTEPEPEPETGLLAGVWLDSTAGRSFSFNDSIWWSGLNTGEYSGSDTGTLFMFGQPYARFELSDDNRLTITEQVNNGETFTLGQVSDQPPAPDSLLSSYTRKGNFIAFTSDRGGHSKGDIYIYTVDSNAYLDTVYYYDLIITEQKLAIYDTSGTAPDIKIDTVYETVRDTNLVKNYIEPIRALTDRDGMDDMPAWSPDGRKLAFISDRGGYPAIWIYFLDEFAAPLAVSDTVPENPRQLTDAGADLADASPTWSPDGSTIAFERQVHTALGDTLRDVFMIASDDYGETVPAWNFTQSPEEDCFNPEWSPREDVSVILFEERQNGTSSDWDIYWMFANDSTGFDPDIDKANKFTNPNKNGHPTWSPDGRRVAFEISPPGSDSIFSINIKPFAVDSAWLTDTLLDTTGMGGKGIELTPQAELPGFNRYPTWLPNGNLIAFIRQRDIWIIDISRGFSAPSWRRMLEDGFRNWDIAW